LFGAFGIHPLSSFCSGCSLLLCCAAAAAGIPQPVSYRSVSGNVLVFSHVPSAFIR
jgi:hypothetical protein